MPAWQFDLTDRATDELTEIWRRPASDRSEVFTRPQAGHNAGYRDVKVYAIDDALTLELDGKKYSELAVKQLLS